MKTRNLLVLILLLIVSLSLTAQETSISNEAKVERSRIAIDSSDLEYYLVMYNPNAKKRKKHRFYPNLSTKTLDEYMNECGCYPIYDSNRKKGIKRLLDKAWKFITGLPIIQNFIDSDSEDIEQVKEEDTEEPAVQKKVK